MARHHQCLSGFRFKITSNAHVRASTVGVGRVRCMGSASEPVKLCRCPDGARQDMPREDGRREKATKRLAKKLGCMFALQMSLVKEAWIQK